jgi:hypothetical protein
MVVRCSYKNIQELAHGLSAAAENCSGKRLVARPWNRYVPENSTWYLIPSSDWPAYRYGKFLLTPWAELFCGFYVEKGLGKITESAYPEYRKHGFTMDATWYWNHFAQEYVSPAFQTAANQVSQAASSPVHLVITASLPEALVWEPEYSAMEIEELREQNTAGQVEYEVGASGSLRLVRQQYIRDQMEPATHCTSLAQLPGILSTPAIREWLWIDFQIGLYVQRAEEFTPDCWTSTEIWKKLLSPWLTWAK